MGQGSSDDERRPHESIRLPTALSSVAVARRFTADHLASVDAPAWATVAELVVSEIVTNAVVHGRGPVEVRIEADPSGCRVEVYDDDPRLPRARRYADTAVTGRGLHIVAELVDRWGALTEGRGKVVWFEIGAPRARLFATHVPPEVGGGTVPTAPVTLLHCPLLLHAAWQEHAQALLRGFVLARAEQEPEVIGLHAAAGAALSELFAHVPEPDVDMAQPLIDAIDERVTADQVRFELAPRSMGEFATLAAMLRRASEAARSGAILGPPIQPELEEFGEWVCAQVQQQSAGAAPEPWGRRTAVSAALVDPADLVGAQRVRAHDARDDVVVTDEASVILHVGRSVLHALGYRDETDLLGRRILVLVPERFHQAHVAGTALHIVNGRSVLVDKLVVVPVVRADGSEVFAQVCVQSSQAADGRRVFIASLTIRDTPDVPPAPRASTSHPYVVEA